LARRGTATRRRRVPMTIARFMLVTPFERNKWPSPDILRLYVIYCCCILPRAVEERRPPRAVRPGHAFRAGRVRLLRRRRVVLPSTVPVGCFVFLRARRGLLPRPSVHDVAGRSAADGAAVSVRHERARGHRLPVGRELPQRPLLSLLLAVARARVL